MAIYDRHKVINFLIKHNIDFKDNGKWLQVCNPWIPDTKYHVGININEGFYNCFKSNDAGGLDKFVSRLENCSLTEARKYLGMEGNSTEEILTNRIDYLQAEYKKKLEEEKKTLHDNEDVGLALPDHSFIIDPTALSMQKPYNFLLNKVGDPTTIREMRAYYCTSGYWGGFIIIPYYLNNEIVYYVGRNTDKTSKTRYRYPKVDDIGKEKNAYLYNYERLRNNSVIILCEGIFNALVVGGMAMGGKDLSDRQIDYLLKIENIHDKKIIVALDQDKPGRGSVQKVCRKLNKYLKNVYFYWTPYIIYYDFADVGKKRSRDLLKSHIFKANVANFVRTKFH